MDKMLLIVAAILLTGCAGMGPYEAQVKIAEHRAVEAKHYADAMWQIAQGGDTTVRTVAAMSLQSRMQGNAGQGFTLAPSPLMQAAQIVVPALTQAWAVDRTSKVKMHMSDNSTRESLGLYGAFTQFASEINSPTVVTQPAPVVVQPEVVQQPAPVIVPPVIVQPEIVTVPGGGD
ncbi:hypothetical protein [Thauera propionica]|uniref:hypothetical protein n=1 Tax=Thauera propionica TaxID=2019431 RepID=UPI0023EFBA87|nr:hypothetical protein [Thauera propionica]MDD3675897.1 hypothetical protein [Thauera propionica]